MREEVFRVRGEGVHGSGHTDSEGWGAPAVSTCSLYFFYVGGLINEVGREPALGIQRRGSSVRLVTCRQRRSYQTRRRELS